MAGGLSFSEAQGNHPAVPLPNHQSEDRMKTTLGIVVALTGVFVATVALGGPQDDIIKMRQRLMDSNGQAAKVAVGMIRGEIPFDATVAAAVVTSISHDNAVVFDLFPDGSDKGDTKAGPEIWKNKADFKALSLKMVADAKAAADAAAKGKDAFAQAFQAVGQNCQACHEKYRQS
jgi:cytochrome c556